MLINITPSHNEVAHFTDEETGLSYQLPVISFGLYQNGETESFICGIVIAHGELTPAEFIVGFQKYSNVGGILH